MKIQHHFYYLTVLISYLGSITSTQAQHISGLDVSNYGGLYRATYNPATLGGTPYKFQVNVLTMGGSIGRRYFDFVGKNSFLTPILASHSTDEIYGRSRTMKSLTNNRIRLQSEIRWPSVLFSVGKAHGFAIQARTRGFIYGYAPPEIKSLYTQRMDTDAPIHITDPSNGDIHIHQQSFSDISFSYGVSVVNTKAHKLKLGVTGKLIRGARLSSIQIQADQFSILPATGNSTSKELQLDQVRYNTFYTSELEERTLPPIFNRSNYGSGHAYDFGISYELGNVWKNKEEKFDTSPTYFLRLAASLTDLGSIHYGRSQGKAVQGIAPQLAIQQQDLENIANKGAKGFMELVEEYSNEIEPGILPTSRLLPSALHLEADVQLVKSFFVNVSTSTGSYGNPGSDQANIRNIPLTRITPRFEGQDFDLAFPITFISGNANPQIGITAHFGPLFVSFSNATGIFLPKDQKRAAMAYVGLSVFKLKK